MAQAASGGGKEMMKKIVKLDSYTMFISMDEASIAEEQRNYIKKIDITVMYKLGTKIKTVSMSTLINK